MSKLNKVLVVIWTIVMIVGITVGNCTKNVTDDGFWICLTLIGMWMFYQMEKKDEECQLVHCRAME